MKTTRKVLAIALCAILLVGASVMGTLAYLTSTDAVTNTFSVGKVAITLDETDVDVDGVEDGKIRVKANVYKLMPSHTYTKDPIVHFLPESEASYLFVKVENGIADIESKAESYKSILAQVTENGWTELDGVDNVYYKSVPANTSKTDAVDYAVFASFTVDTAANTAAYETAEITINAYAIQADGFTTATEAWTAGAWA